MRRFTFFSTVAVLTGFASVNVSAEVKNTRAMPAQPRSGAGVLPVEEWQYPGKLGLTPATSSPPQFPPETKPPVGAPNIVIILTDDVGFGASSTFGGPVPTRVFDQLASQGLRYNRFHTTALCAPTRASLLTGRNPHSVATGTVPDIATGYPGYNGLIPKNAATVGEILKQNGYNTAWFGKNHNTPAWFQTRSGPFDRWPNGLGFEYFYGFNQAQTDQFAPALYENQTQVEAPTNDPTYILDRDLADHAIKWLRSQKEAAPDKPFLIYLAPGTAHAPHQAPREWIERYRGKFSQGWDKMREESFARQKALGVIPADTVLTPRPAEIPAWDSLNPDQKQVAERMMEVYAGALSYADDQIGRLFAELDRQGLRDNTLIFYIQGDNGASGEGGVFGATIDLGAFNGLTEDTAFMKSRLAALGGPKTTSNYPVGWAWAMNTPLQWTKQIASHLGGVRNGMVVSWPKGIKQTGQVRSQFHHVADIMPTILDAAGITVPHMVNGVEQKPLEGVSMTYSFADAKAPGQRRVQYFEQYGNRAIYSDGWMASTTPERMPWNVFSSGKVRDPLAFKWELYDLSKDFSQAKDLASVRPDKLAELKQIFHQEALKYDIYPLDNDTSGRSAGRRGIFAGRSSVVLSDTGWRYQSSLFPNIRNTSWVVEAKFSSHDAPNGTIIANGGQDFGWGLFLFDGKPTLIYRSSPMADGVIRLASPVALSPGKHVVTVGFDYDGGPRGSGGTLVMKADGVTVATARLEKTVQNFFDLDGGAVGYDTGTALTEDYAVPFRFNGQIETVKIDTKPQ